MKFLKEHSAFIGILTFCTILRFLPLFDYQFTYDELSGMERTQFNSFSEVIEKGVKIDAHPAFVQLLIYYLTKIFGYITWIIKLPFLLFSLGTVIYAYALGLRNFSKQTGLFAAAVFSFSLIFIFYAPIARMYISGIFFSLALLYYFFEIVFLKNLKPSNYFFLGLFAFLSALNQHINALFALTVCVSGFLFLNKQNYKAYIITCVLVIVAYLPNLPVTLYQLGVGGIGREKGGWLEVPEFSVIFYFLKALFGTGRVYFLILFLIVVKFILEKRIHFTKSQLFLLLIFVFNFLVVYCYSIIRSPIFQYSVMLFSATAIVIFVCSLMEFKSIKLFYAALITLCVVLLYKSYIKKDYFNQSVKTVYEYQFERTIYYKSLYGDKNVYPIFFDADEIMKKIYFEKYSSRFDCRVSSDSLIANMEKVYFEREKDPFSGEKTAGIKISPLRLFSEFVSKLNSDYLVISSAMPQHQAVVSGYFPYLIENTQTQAINYKVYSRRPEDKTKTISDDKIYHYSTLKEAGNFVYPKVERLNFSDGSFSIKIDSLNEFPFGTRAALREVTTKEGQVILVKAKVKLRQKYSPLEVCITVTDNSTNEQYAYNAKAASDFVIGEDSTITIYSEHFNGTKYNSIKYKSNVNVYLWNRGKENFEIKDFEIKVIDYWSRKWDLWN